MSLSTIIRVAVAPLSFFVLSVFTFAQQEASEPLASIIEATSSVDRVDDVPFVPNVKPTIKFHRTNGNIQVDGDLEDAGWINAARATNFTEFQPDEGADPPVDIFGWLAYDDKNLYVAIKVEDDPSEIRANLSNRDEMYSDDWAGLVLDTGGDGRTMLIIAVNPFGVQGDSRITYNGEDEGFDLIYRSEGRIVEDGYQIEMAIPFRSLRFPKAEIQHWRGTFLVTHPRDSRNQYSWAALDLNNACISCQLGYLEGIQDVTSGNNLEILPSLVGGQAGALANFDDAAEGFNNEKLSLEPSLDLRYGITSDLTAEVTFNPDFSQIESDAAQIDVNTTFALSFPERRPFFQEGGDLFGTFFQTMYSRSINDPIFAGKVTGRIGSTDVAYLTARDYNTPLLLPFEEKSDLVEAGRSLSNIARIRHAFPDNSYIGGLLTDRHIDGGGSGTTVGMDGMYRLGKNYMLEGQFVLSRTAEVDDPSLSGDFGDETFDGGTHTASLDGEIFGGHALYAGFGRDGRHWNFRTRYREFSPTFRADNGFVTQNNMRNLMMWQGYTIFPKQVAFIDQIQPSVALWREWNFDDVRKSDGISTEMSFNMKGQTYLYVEWQMQRERFADREFSGLNTLGAGITTSFNKHIQLHACTNIGTNLRRDIDDPDIGDYFRLHLNATIRPTSQFFMSPDFSYAELRHKDTGEPFYSGFIVRSRLNYQITRQLMVRTVVQYNDFSERLEVDPLLTYRINPLTVFHIGSTHDMRSVDTSRQDIDQIFRQTERQFFFKFQYLVRA